MLRIVCTGMAAILVASLMAACGTISKDGSAPADVTCSTCKSPGTAFWASRGVNLRHNCTTDARCSSEHWICPKCAKSTGQAAEKPKDVYCGSCSKTQKDAKWGNPRDLNPRHLCTGDGTQCAKDHFMCATCSGKSQEPVGVINKYCGGCGKAQKELKWGNPRDLNPRHMCSGDTDHCAKEHFLCTSCAGK